MVGIIGQIAGAAWIWLIQRLVKRGLPSGRYDLNGSRAHQRIYITPSVSVHSLPIDGDAWCLQIWQAHHRAAAAVATGLETVPVRIAESPVHREDTKHWYQV